VVPRLVKRRGVPGHPCVRKFETIYPAVVPVERPRNTFEDRKGISVNDVQRRMYMGGVSIPHRV
jgi:hypothetical protein